MQVAAALPRAEPGGVGEALQLTQGRDEEEVEEVVEVHLAAAALRSGVCRVENEEWASGRASRRNIVRWDGSPTVLVHLQAFVCITVR